MSRHDPSVSLRQMRDHAHEVAELMRGRSRGDLESDRLLAIMNDRDVSVQPQAGDRVKIVVEG